MRKSVTKIVKAVLGFALAIGAGVGAAISNPEANPLLAAGTTVASFSRSGSNNSISGGTFSSAASAQTGYYQDGSGTLRYLQILNDSAYWSSIPSSITFDAKIGGGSGDTDLTDAVQVVLLGSGGSVLSTTNVTSHITTNTGDNYSISITPVNNVYGVKLQHQKQSGYNVRYYSFSLSYQASGAPATYSVTYHDNYCTSGSVPTDNTQYSSGANVTVLGNTGSLTRTGYTWAGWSVNEDGSGTAYGPNYTTTYPVATSDINFYPKWEKYVAPLPESGTITITGNDVDGSYGTDAPYTVEEDNTPYSEFGFKCTNVMKNNNDLQFKKNSEGILYSTTPLSYLRNVVISGTNTSGAVIKYGTSQNNGCTSDTIGTTNTYFKITNTSANAGYWNIVITYSLEAPDELTELRISSGLESVKKIYDDGEAFDPTGLVIQAKWNSTWDEVNNVLNDVVWTPSTLTAGTTSVTGTYTFGVNSETVTVSGLTVNGPNFVIDGNENKPANVLDSTNTNVGQGKVNSTGVNYGFYALQTYNSNLEFNQSVDGAYIGNNDSYGKYIRKIRVTLVYASDFSKLTMFKGETSIPGETSVSTTTNSGATRLYSFENDSEFFALKQTTTSNSQWIQIVKIEVFLGSNVPVIASVSASLKAGTHYEGTTLSASDFDVTVSWTEGKANTYPTSGFTWTVNGNNNGSLIEGDNSVVVTYEGVPSAAFNVVGAPAAAKDVIESTLATKTDLTYHYNRTENITTDSIDLDFTEVPAETNYVSWDSKSGSSGAVYAGKNAGDHSSIQLNGTDKGIITTTSGGKATKVTLAWNENTAEDRTIDIYGKNSAYEAVTDLFDNEKQGTLLGSIVKGTSTSVTITGSYEYIGIRVHTSKAMYLDLIEIEWAAAPTYAYTNAAVKFGGSVSTTLWNRLNTESNGILGYGVMIATAEYLSGLTIKNYYDLARDGKTDVDSVFTEVDGKSYTLVDGLSIKCFYNEVSTMPRLINGNYVWDLVKGVNGTNAGLTKDLTAVAFIRTTDDEIIFLQETTKSAAQVAKDMINADPDDEFDNAYAEGSLGYLAGLAA